MFAPPLFFRHIFFYQNSNNYRFNAKKTFEILTNIYRRNETDVGLPNCWWWKFGPFGRSSLWLIFARELKKFNNYFPLTNLFEEIDEFWATLIFGSWKVVKINVGFSWLLPHRISTNQRLKNLTITLLSALFTEKDVYFISTAG